jgi:hypothetical protein
LDSFTTRGKESQGENFQIIWAPSSNFFSVNIFFVEWYGYHDGITTLLSLIYIFFTTHQHNKADINVGETHSWGIAVSITHYRLSVTKGQIEINTFENPENV